MIKYIFLLVGAVSMLVMSLHYFSDIPSGILIGKAIAETNWYLLLLRLHISLGLIAMFSGIVQWIPKLFFSSHRLIGSIYVVGVTVSSLCGLIIAQFAMGGWISSVGFSVLAMIWLSTTWIGVQKIVNKKEKAHQRWMMLSYALTFATIPQRTMLLIPLFTTVPFIPIYQLSAWLPWLLNLSIAYFIIQSKTA